MLFRSDPDPDPDPDRDRDHNHDPDSDLDSDRDHDPRRACMLKFTSGLRVCVTATETPTAIRNVSAC